MSPPDSAVPAYSASPTGQRRVLWLVKGLGPGGAERLLVLTARLRDRERVSYRVAYLLPHKDRLVPDLAREGVEALCLGTTSSWDPRWLSRLRRLLRHEQFDVVHSHSPLVTAGARLVVRSLPSARRPRLVTTEHNLWQSYARPTRTASVLTASLDDARIAVSEAVRDSLPARMRQLAEVVRYGVDIAGVQAATSARDEMRRELGLTDSEVLVGTIANLRPNKAYPDLLAAARTVLDHAPGVRFVAVGQGPQETEIRRLHSELRLGERFLLLGYRPDAVRVLAACDIFCLASRHEGLPVALMEALVLGLPVVATDVGGVGEVVEHGREGHLVPPGRPELLALALEDLVGDGTARAVAAAHARERGASLGIETAVRRTEAVYDEVLDR